MISCRNHPDRAASMRCEQCGRAYCRDCVHERWITARSAEWVCTSCASGARGIRLPVPTPFAAVVALVALLALAVSTGLLR